MFPGQQVKDRALGVAEVAVDEDFEGQAGWIFEAGLFHS